ncbi:RNA-binding cell elongation regulator Jag/EloR [Halothermothrix orenii]|uniref:RNA-binding protein KhpB n=1 Tax=Halothermothrix orenii (strain H 168 / OCM 544 / DSM 9562) TaxID=373903 RepID=B8D1F0_HALOH|nr:RNA-binding cell elongation regulator Jag/EloR [Halothermothrix orenii]ACL71102.1 single-stranded nucleic acid binding R3H domain protein [Halothermothrix orenii H 168]
MDVVRQEGKTVEDAVEQALQKLNITRDEAEIKVIDEGSKGIFGLIGGKNAVVEVKPKVNPASIALDFLEDVLEKIPVATRVEVIEEKTDYDQVYLNISGDNLGIIIGYRGETLDALQYLTSLVVNRELKKYTRVLLDAEGYRERRKKTLERLANKLARKAIRVGRKVVLEPMPPHERRIIHMTLKDSEQVYTYSEGQEPYRRVLIAPRMEKDNG